jgi:serine/threonine-protein kinase
METLVSTAGEPVPLPGGVSDFLPPGAKAGPWVVERELGRGGMGAVYAVVHDEIGKRAALKVVHGRLLGTGFNPDRMLVEARVVNQVGHPNIVDIFETGELPDGRPYIVMERLEGQSLAQRVDASKLEPELAIAILRQICDALIAAHAAGIVHRDLKLDNVFLVDNLEDPGTPRVKILDWGIAKVVHHDVRHTVEGQLVGTPQYLAPEQARGARVSPKTDVYSLGVLAYELFLDQLPFEAETSAEIMAMHLRATPPPPRDLWPEIPWQLEELLLEMLAKRPDHRPTMLEVANRLEAVRLELEQRRRANEAAEPAQAPATPPAFPAAAAASAAMMSPPAPEARWCSADAHAPTKPAQWRLRAPRWRYVAGALAIAGCVVMFLVSRGGDRVASAAEPSPAEAEALAAPTPVAAPPPEAPDGELAAPPMSLPARPEPSTGLLRSPTRERPHAGKPAARTQPASAAQLRRAPAAPRRSAKLDPDGTIDPYR